MTTNNAHVKTTQQERIVFKLFKNLQRGSLILETPEGKTFHFHGATDGTNAHLKIKRWDLIDKIFSRGDIGFGESYRDGDWQSHDISKVIQMAIENEKAFKKVIMGSSLSLIPYVVKHKLNKNTQKGSKKNIQAHYDLGNNFYQLWLDPTMTYSSAYFKGEEDLQQAQQNKYDQILKKLSNLPDGAKVVEVGCGWGGFIKRAMEKRNFKIKGLTLSHEQKAYVENHVGPYAHIQDYRQERGLYDGLVSIEMFEALGAEYWKKYFKKIATLLKTGAPAVIQTITINEQDFPAYKRGTDFIQQYIFPGGMLPTVEVFSRLAQKSGFKIVHAESFGKSYAKTLRIWEKDFMEKLDEVRNIGFDDSFIKLWQFYLNYCEGAFESSKINVYQFHLEKV